MARGIKEFRKGQSDQGDAEIVVEPKPAGRKRKGKA